MFPDGFIQHYGTNVISENLFSQVDGDGYRYHTLEVIIEHPKSGIQASKEDEFIQ